MIRSMYRTATGKIETDIPESNYSLAIKDEDGLLWVDIYNESDDVSKKIMLDTFKFHGLAVADAIDETHVPKVDDWESYLYLVVRAAVPGKHIEQRLETEEIDIFLGKNYIVTFHSKQMTAVERTWKHFQKDERLLKSSSTDLLYNLIDEIASDYMLLAENIGESLNAIEDEIFGDPKPVVLEKIFSLKRDLLHLRRILAPQREVINKLARSDYKILEADSRMYFHDLYDHFLRLYDILENLRDLTGSSLEIYLSVVNNRMNNIMRILTLITTLFMPISFLVGFFGMNFFQPINEMKTWTGTLAFQLLIGALFVVPIIMYITIRKKGWM